MVDGAVARDRDQPGHRTRQGRIESSGLTPHRHVDLLQHILSFAVLAQDTHANGKKLRRGQSIDRLQRFAVAAAGRGKGCGYEFTVAVEVHGQPRVSNKRAQKVELEGRAS